MKTLQSDLHYILTSLGQCHPSLLHPCIWNNVPRHPRTISWTCCCRQLSILVLWNINCIDIHTPLPFQSSKMHRRLVWVHAILSMLHLCIQINDPVYPTPSIQHASFKWLVVSELWKGDCISTHAPSPFTLSKMHIIYWKLFSGLQKKKSSTEGSQDFWNF